MSGEMKEELGKGRIILRSGGSKVSSYFVPPALDTLSIV